MFAARTAAVDAHVAAAASEHFAGLKTPFTAVAVGGYGRRELFPHSDVDLLLLFPDEEALNGLKQPLSQFMRVLWDSGARLSHSVRTVAECIKLNDQNTELHISLLDTRYLCGDEALFKDLRLRLPIFFEKHAPILSKRLCDLARQRHSKFNDTVYHLEPNVKEAPGGIRDLHLLRWLGQLLPRHEAVRDCLAELQNSERFLFSVRCALHLLAGRDNNLLTFELQDRIAETLPPRPEVPEEWIRQYYAHAREIFQPALRAMEHVETHDSSLFGQIRDMRRRLSTSEFTVSKDRILLRNPPDVFASADAIFRLFTFVARHGIRLSWDAQRRLRSNVHICEETFRRQPVNRLAWRELLSQPFVALALREMQETGILAAAIPEWKTVDSLVVRDFYHRYTVDEHTFVAIETIDNLVANKSGTPARFHGLAMEEGDLAVLRFAILLHDIGKGTDPGEHVRGSLTAASTIMERLGVPLNKRDDVLFLIEQHLLLSSIMNGRDLEDPATARMLTSQVGTQERLRQLTLLTYADISAVNPTAMTPWRLEQLWRVYSLGLEQLTRELVSDRIHLPQNLPSKLAAFLEGLPTRYLRTHTSGEIERHHAMSERIAAEHAVIEIIHEGPAYQLTLLGEDHPGLFSSVCGALSSFGMNIVKAEAFSNAAGIVVDVFRFEDATKTLELNPSEKDRLEWTVSCVAKGTVDAETLLARRRPKRIPSSGAKILPHVKCNNEASEHATLIDVIAEDRPGLLYDLTRTLSAHGCNIEVVLIDTEAHRAIDVFYVTVQGNKMPEQSHSSIEAALAQAAFSN